MQLIVQINIQNFLMFLEQHHMSLHLNQPSEWAPTTNAIYSHSQFFRYDFAIHCTPMPPAGASQASSYLTNVLAVLPPCLWDLFASTSEYYQVAMTGQTFSTNLHTKHFDISSRPTMVIQSLSMDWRQSTMVELPLIGPMIRLPSLAPTTQTVLVLAPTMTTVLILHVPL